MTKRKMTASKWFLLVVLAGFHHVARGSADVNVFLEPAGGNRVAGRIEVLPNGTAQFVETNGKSTTRLESGMIVRFEGKGLDSATGLPPYRLELGLGQRLCGRLGNLGEREIELLDTTGGAAMKVARAGTHALIQRPGETLIFQDGFESIDPKRWKVTGQVGVTGVEKVAGEHSLKLSASGGSLTHQLKDPFASGRLEVAFSDRGAKLEGAQWFVDLTFRGQTGPETIRAILGWAEESLAVESPTGPALAVQRLGRKPDWHRLSVWFLHLRSRHH